MLNSLRAPGGATALPGDKNLRVGDSSPTQGGIRLDNPCHTCTETRWYAGRGTGCSDTCTALAEYKASLHKQPTELEITRKALELAVKCVIQDSEKAVQLFLDQAKEVLK